VVFWTAERSESNRRRGLASTYEENQKLGLGLGLDNDRPGTFKSQTRKASTKISL